MSHSDRIDLPSFVRSQLCLDVDSQQIVGLFTAFPCLAASISGGIGKGLSK
jgi:hypothetical protein